MTGERQSDLLDKLGILNPSANIDMLEILLDLSEQDFLAICNRSDVPEAADGLLLQMTMYRLNQLGAEGLSAQSFSGQSESLMSDYPDAMKRSMYRYRRVKIL